MTPLNEITGGTSLEGCLSFEPHLTDPPSKSLTSVAQLPPHPCKLVRVRTPAYHLRSSSKRIGGPHVD